MHSHLRWKLASMLLIATVLASLAAAPGQTASATARNHAAPRTARATTASAQRAPAQPKSPSAPRPIYRADGTIDIGPVVRKENLPLKLEPGDVQSGPRLTAATDVTYTVGMTRTFIVRNDVSGAWQRSTYDVRYIGNLAEVWVQSDLRYRNPDNTINYVHPDAADPLYITNERIATLAAAAEQIIPRDVDFFGDYAERTGANASLLKALNLPANYYAGPGKRVIILVSNVRDENFYDPINNPSYIAGFYSPTVNAFADRNIITIDSKAWNRNVGAPSFQYEATIAHEFQHLINGDQDEDEESWANEGRSEYAEFLNGYRPTAEDHRTQWSDYPENSLTLWGDQDDDPDQSFEILADYQEAYWFFLYLAGRLQAAGIHTANNQFLKDVAGLTKDPANGAASIDAMLTAVGAPFRFNQVWSDFRTAMLFGGTSDQTDWGSYISKYPSPSGEPIAPLDLGRMRRNLNFEGYDQPGAPPYGSDYIEIGWSQAINAQTKLTFNGETAIPTDWTVVPANTTGITPTGSVAGNVLYSGHTDLTDNFLIFPVTVPASKPTLSFDTLYNIEEGWDYGFVQATADTAGATGFTSLPLAGTSVISDTGAHPIIKANVPGFTGLSGVAVPADPETDTPKWVHVTFDMSAYAGKSILLAFRYSTDWGSEGTIAPPPAAGWYLDNIKVNNTALYTNEAAVPAAAKSIWQARNKQISFKLDVATFANKNGAAVTGVSSATLDANGDGTFDLGALLSNPGFNEPGERVVALVSNVGPTADNDLISAPTGYAPYKLTGLPPSLYTSRARAIGTASNTSLSRPRVYPGDTFTMTVTLDNLGRNDDLQTTGPASAYVAVPIPANAEFVPGMLSANVANANMTYTANLQSLDSGLPAAPGVYWHGTVTRTADLAFRLRAPSPLAVDTVITPTAYIANGPFGSNPSQSFTDIQTPVTVVSPLALSQATGPAKVMIGATSTYTYTLINTDDQPRDISFHLALPDGVSLVGISANAQAPGGAAVQATDIVLPMTVPSYQQTGKVLVVAVKVRIDPSFVGSSFAPRVELLQPGSSIPYTVPQLTLASVGGRVPSGASGIEGRLYLPVMRR